MRRCRKHTRRVCWRCITVTLIFYTEHFLCEKVFPFSVLTHALGL